MTLSFRQILSAARRLPRRSQEELASVLLKRLRAGTATGGAVEPLTALSQAELRAIADSVLAPRQARKLRQLLLRHREGKLQPTLRTELDRLLVECDLLALLKSKALYTLGMPRA